MKKLLLSILAVGIGSVALAQCTDLFFSEYAEGSGNNNALEIYNPTNATIDLSGYVVKRYSGGSGTETAALTLSGNLLSGDVIVVGNGQTDSSWVDDPPGYWSLPVDPVFYSILDLYCNGDYNANSTLYFNGDDAITLETTSGDIVDIFGKVGEDPGLAWTDDATAGYTDANGGTFWSKRQTLIRKSSVESGVTMNPTEFNPTLEWDSLPDDTWDSLGTHTCGCATLGVNEKETKFVESIYIFPNPITSGNFEVKATKAIEVLEIYNVIGKVIYKEFNSEKSGTIKVSMETINPGVYLVKAALENGDIITKKALIK